jgi:transcriptional accessory protein Tex/SPT6
MIETVARPDTDQLLAKLETLAQNPPESVTIALREMGLSLEDLEQYARGGISPEGQEALRKVVLHAAKSGSPDDAKLAAQLRGFLDPRERAWERVARLLDTGETITAMVTEAVKGGLVVDLGVRGFVPASHVGLGGPPNLNSFVGQTLPFRVIEVDRRRQKVILSNRVVAEEERQSMRRDLMTTLAEGQTREGIVRRLTEIGAFVDLGGIDGLLHVSELSWKRVEKPSDVLKVGQKIEVKILKVDPEAGRISLSRRKLLPDPWAEASGKFKVGAKASVTVRRFVNGGVVVDLGDEIEGFIPMSELAARRVGKPEEVVQLGQTVEASVIEVRPRDRRIVLSLREHEEEQDRKAYSSYVQKEKTNDRTTIGDLFGHLFKDFLPEEAKSEAPPTEAKANDGKASAEAVTTSEKPAAEVDSSVEAPPAAVEEPAAEVAEAVTPASTETETAETETSSQ